MNIQTSLKTGWVIRAMVMIVLGYGFAVWAFYDGTVAYPKRGETYARFMEEYWLRALGPDQHRAADIVADPRPRFEMLRERNRAKEPMNEAERAEHDWLRALNVIGRLDDAPRRAAGPSDAWLADNPEQIASPSTRLAELAELNSEIKGQPKRLNSYDIPSQWVILAVGLLVGTWSLVNFLRHWKRTFVYNHEDGSLTIDGRTIPADQMKTIDKSRWQKKSIAYLVTKDGERHTLDDWIYARTEDIVEIIEKKLEGDDGPAGEPPAETESPPGDAEDTVRD